MGPISILLKESSTQSIKLKLGDTKETKEELELAKFHMHVGRAQRVNGILLMDFFCIMFGIN